jgi:hypothetical protein
MGVTVDEDPPVDYFGSMDHAVKVSFRDLDFLVEAEKVEPSCCAKAGRGTITILSPPGSSACSLPCRSAGHFRRRCQEIHQRGGKLAESRGLRRT